MPDALTQGHVFENVKFNKRSTKNKIFDDIVICAWKKPSFETTQTCGLKAFDEEVFRESRHITTTYKVLPNGCIV